MTNNGLKMHRMILFVVAASLLSDSDGAVKVSREDYVSIGDGGRQSVHNLQCEEGGRILVVDVRIAYKGFPCCRSGDCYDWPPATQFAEYLTSCGNSSTCTLFVRDEPRVCSRERYHPVYVSVLYTCSTASTVMPMDSLSSTSGRSVAAVFSSPDLQTSSSVLACVVEASDCTLLNSSLELVILNTERTSSYFSTVFTERLGEFTLRNTAASSLTPYRVTLDIVKGSQVPAAYVLATASRNVTMTCGLSRSISLYQTCAVPIVSARPSRMLGQVMSARYSSSQGVSATGTWLCSVQAADCSSDTTVSVLLYVYNTHGSPVSTLSMNNVSLGTEEVDSTQRSVEVPFNVTLTLVQGSSPLVFVDVNASALVSLTCGPSSEPVVTDFCHACQSSFQCLCPAGFHSSSNGRACLEVTDNDQSQGPAMQAAAVAGAVVGILLVIAVIVVIVVVVLRRRGCTLRTAEKTTNPDRVTTSRSAETAYVNMNGSVTYQASPPTGSPHPLPRQQITTAASHGDTNVAGDVTPLGYSVAQSLAPQSTPEPEQRPTSSTADQYANCGEAVAMTTAKKDDPYDVLGQTSRPTNTGGNAAYGHLGLAGDDVDYAYDHTCRVANHDVIKSDVYDVAKPATDKTDDLDGDGGYDTANVGMGRRTEVVGSEYDGLVEPTYTNAET